MTLVAAWIRKMPGGQELIVASDSRIGGGITLNHAPKIFRLERQDAVLAYCGPTLLAYPIILQIKASLDGYEESRNRIIDIIHLKSHIEKTIEALRAKVNDLPCDDGSNKKFKFMFAGYSWKTESFRVWTFRYDINSNEFNAFAMPTSQNFMFMSDNFENEHEARNMVIRSLERKAKSHSIRLDWEPLSALISIIKDHKFYDIGGPPQIVKVYKHANTMPLNVLWPYVCFEYGLRRTKYEVTHLGRPLLGYERSRYLTLEPETMDLIEPWNIPLRIAQRNNLEEINDRRWLYERLCNVINNFKAEREISDLINDMLNRKCKMVEICCEIKKMQQNFSRLGSSGVCVLEG